MNGPFYFAWVDVAETTFGEEHLREDEYVFSHTLGHDEGDFPTLEVTIQNPRVGLLAPGRDVWAWFAVDTTWTPPDPLQYESDESELPSEVSEAPSEAGVVPMFFGRLVGLPEEITEDLIRLTFTARPVDYYEQKVAAADALRVVPYDGIWFAPENREDPDNVLEFYPRLWHVDRITHVVTASDIINGEDGAIDIDEDEAFADSVKVTLDSTPVRRVEVTASVSWSQIASGTLDISGMLNFDAPYQIRTLTGDGLVDRWPEAGKSLGGGWSVLEGSAVRTDSVGGAIWTFVDTGVVGIPPVWGRTPEMYGQIMPPGFGQQAVLGTIFPARVFFMPIMRITPHLVLQYSADRKRSESVLFAIEADMQAIVTDPGDEEVLRIDLSSAEIVTLVDGGVPMDVTGNTFWTTDRGTDCIKSLVAMARAKLLARARAVRVEFEIPYLEGVALALSCRKNAAIHDPRLPGGVAEGKIVSYVFASDGDTGDSSCIITIASAVGKGGTITEVPGTPSWFEEGYIAPEYQVYDGAYIMAYPGEIAFESIAGSTPTNDDGWNFRTGVTASFAVLTVLKENTVAEQQAAVGSNNENPNEAYTKLNEVPTRITVTMRPVTGGPFDNTFSFDTTQLKVPKQIDLEASV